MNIFTNKIDYLTYQKFFFENTNELMIVDNHSQHNNDPEYWDILLKEIKENKSKWKNKIALDFGCGCGRNIKNLLDLAEWKRVDGCDISKKNATYSKNWVSTYHSSNKTITWETDGESIRPCEDNYYDFIMSHIVFQHISSYNVRVSILKDLYRCLKHNGFISLHFMDLGESNSYYDSTMVFKNSRVENETYLIKDFEKIGFNEITCVKGIDYQTGVNTYYIKGKK